VLAKVGASDHAEAKRRVQEKYFGKSDARVALFAFVGRIVLQKGVHLILECARAILSQRRDDNMPQVQILVGGPANKKDP
jgi:glycogen synthase